MLLATTFSDRHLYWRTSKILKWFDDNDVMMVVVVSMVMLVIYNDNDGGKNRGNDIV